MQTNKTDPRMSEPGPAANLGDRSRAPPNQSGQPPSILLSRAPRFPLLLPIALPLLRLLTTYLSISISAGLKRGPRLLHILTIKGVGVVLVRNASCQSDTISDKVQKGTWRTGADLGNPLSQRCARRRVWQRGPRDT